MNLLKDLDLENNKDYIFLKSRAIEFYGEATKGKTISHGEWRQLFWGITDDLDLSLAAESQDFRDNLTHLLLCRLFTFIALLGLYINLEAQIFSTMSIEYVLCKPDIDLWAPDSVLGLIFKSVDKNQPLQLAEISFSFTDESMPINYKDIIVNISYTRSGNSKNVGNYALKEINEDLITKIIRGWS